MASSEANVIFIGLPDAMCAQGAGQSRTPYRIFLDVVEVQMKATIRNTAAGASARALLRHVLRVRILVLLDECC